MTGDFGGVQVVWVDLNQKPRDLVDTIIHESVHVFQHFLAHIGEAVVGKETQAYAIAYIATTLLGELENCLALHEEWKARLQNGVCEVPGDPRTEAPEVGTDSAEEQS